MVPLTEMAATWEVGQTTGEYLVNYGQGDRKDVYDFVFYDHMYNVRVLLYVVMYTWYGRGHGVAKVLMG